MANKMFSNVINKMVSNFVPQEDTEARISIQGTIVVNTQTPNGKEWVDKDANVYPEEMLSDFPVFTIAKPVAKVKVGDVVKLTKSTFATVTSIADGKVETLSFGGQHRQAKAFKDMFLGQATVRVVVNPLAGIDNGNNSLMMLALLDKDSEDKNDFMTTAMVMSMLSGAGQNPLGDLTKNPMALMMLMKGDGGSVQDILMLQAMQNGGLANLFTAPAAKTEADNTQAEA
jgi:hypothetical protein